MDADFATATIMDQSVEINATTRPETVNVCRMLLDSDAKRVLLVSST
jgi:hypothetical protein